MKDCEGEHKVWTREGTTFTAHPVKIGISNGISTEIISGVAEGTKVVTEATIGAMPDENMNRETGSGKRRKKPVHARPSGKQQKEKQQVAKYEKSN